MYFVAWEMGNFASYTHFRLPSLWSHCACIAQWGDIVCFAQRNLPCLAPSCWAIFAVACVGTHTHTAHKHTRAYPFIFTWLSVAVVAVVVVVICTLCFWAFLGSPRAFNVVYRLSCHLSAIALLISVFIFFGFFLGLAVSVCHLLRASSSASSSSSLPRVETSKYLTFIMVTRCCPSLTGQLLFHGLRYDFVPCMRH